MKFRSILVTSLFASSFAFATQPQKPSAVCTVVQKSIKAVAPTPESKVVPDNALVKQMKDVKSVSLLGYADMWSGITLIQDDVYIKFKDVPTTVNIESNTKGVAMASYATTQSTKLFTQKGAQEITKNDDIADDPFIARYKNEYRVMKTVHNPGDMTVLQLTVDSVMQTDHKLAVRAYLYLGSYNEKDGAAFAELNCKDGMGGRFTFKQSK